MKELTDQIKSEFVFFSRAFFAEWLMTHKNY